MKKILMLVVLSLSISLPSFGAEHVVSHSPKSQARTLTRRQLTLRRELARQEKRLEVRFLI